MPRPLKYDVSYLQVGEVKEFSADDIDDSGYGKMRRAIVATGKRHGKRYKMERGDGVVRVERVE